MNKAVFPSKNFLIVLSIFVDAFLVFAADISAFLIRFGWAKGPFPRTNFAAYLKLLFPIIVLRLLCFYIYGLYDKPKYKSTYDKVLSVIKATSTSTLIIIAAAFFFRAFAYPRMVIFLSWLITIPLIIIWRLVTQRLINLVLGKDYFVSNVLIVGTNRSARRLATRLLREAAITRRLVGFISVEQDGPAETEPDMTLGTMKDIPSLPEKYIIDEVVIVSPSLRKEEILDIFTQFSQTDAIFRIVPNLYEATIGSMASSPTEQVPLISPISYRAVRYKDLKRLIDTTAAVLGLIFFAPLMLLLMLLIKVTSAGPALYKQIRAGLHGTPFTLYKFRTMYLGSEENGPAFARHHDQRITPVGKLLRRFRLDELPQLYNVLINDMSLIGPRPERP